MGDYISKVQLRLTYYAVSFRLCNKRSMHCRYNLIEFNSGYSPKWSVKTFKFECIFTIFIDKKGGQCNIQLKNVRKKRKLFFKDIFTTAVDIEWRYTLLAFAAAFFVSWTVFAVLYWIIAIYRGDLEPNNLPQNQESSGWRPCVLEMYNFTSFYLFSVETQHTIG